MWNTWEQRPQTEREEHMRQVMTAHSYLAEVRGYSLFMQGRGGELCLKGVPFFRQMGKDFTCWNIERGRENYTLSFKC